MAIGWIEDAEYTDHEITLQPGDRLYVYSDGLPDAINAESEQFSKDRMQTIIADGKSSLLDDSVGHLLDSVKAWVGEGGLTDDVSVLGLQISEEVDFQ